eukprot:7377106-Prymnesium_polylepis.2
MQQVVLLDLHERATPPCGLDTVWREYLVWWNVRCDLPLANGRADRTRLLGQCGDPALLAKECLALRVLTLRAGLAHGVLHTALQPMKSALPVRCTVRTYASQVVFQRDALLLRDTADPLANVGTSVLRMGELLERDNPAAKEELGYLIYLELPQVCRIRLLHIRLCDARVRRFRFRVGPHVDLPCPMRQATKLLARHTPALHLLLNLQLLNTLGDAMLSLVVRECGTRLVPCGGAPQPSAYCQRASQWLLRCVGRDLASSYHHHKIDVVVKSFLKRMHSCILPARHERLELAALIDQLQRRSVILALLRLLANVANKITVGRNLARLVECKCALCAAQLFRRLDLARPALLPLAEICARLPAQLV